MQSSWKILLHLVERLRALSMETPPPGQLTIAQARTAGVIFSGPPEGVMLKEIATELNLTPSAVSQTVDWLVKEDIVERCTSPTDRRAVVIRPTPRGEALRQEHDRRISEIMGRCCVGIPPDDAEVFLRVLRQLQDRANAEWRARIAADNGSAEP